MHACIDRKKYTSKDNTDDKKSLNFVISCEAQAKGQARVLKDLPFNVTKRF